MIGVIAGTGFESDEAETVVVTTPYGEPSAPLRRRVIAGRSVIMLQRHGIGHSIPPHKINYRANLYALRAAGVQSIVSVGAVGNLNPAWRVGDLVICSQFVNRTFGRDDTYFDGPEVRHVPMSDPYCARLSSGIVASARASAIPIREDAMLVVIQGPRYSTRAENRDWRRSGYDVISMTHYPEVALARELGLCFSSLCLITDHASVLDDPDTPPVSVGHDAIVRAFKQGRSRLFQTLAGLVERQDSLDRDCACREFSQEAELLAAGVGQPEVARQRRASAAATCDG